MSPTPKQSPSQVTFLQPCLSLRPPLPRHSPGSGLSLSLQEALPPSPGLRPLPASPRGHCNDSSQNRTQPPAPKIKSKRRLGGQVPPSHSAVPCVSTGLGAGVRRDTSAVTSAYFCSGCPPHSRRRPPPPAPATEGSCLGWAREWSQTWLSGPPTRTRSRAYTSRLNVDGSASERPAQAGLWCAHEVCFRPKVLVFVFINSWLFVLLWTKNLGLQLFIITKNYFWIQLWLLCVSQRRCMI